MKDTETSKWKKMSVSMTLVVFLGAVAVFFSPLSVPYKVVWPVALLALGSVFTLSPKILCAFLFSAVGDWMGCEHNFIAQMGFFGLAHACFIWYFVGCLKVQTRVSRWHVVFATIPILILYSIAIFTVVGRIPFGFLRGGTAIYTTLILIMFWSTLMQRNFSLMVGAALFVLSDFILAWDKFVVPVDHASLWIMIPYYGGQLLLYLGLNGLQTFKSNK